MYRVFAEHFRFPLEVSLPREAKPTLLSNFLRRLRETSRPGESLASVADALGITKSLLSKIERGEMNRPSDDLLGHMFVVYGCNDLVRLILVALHGLSKQGKLADDGGSDPYVEPCRLLFTAAARHGLHFRYLLNSDVSGFPSSYGFYGDIRGEAIVTTRAIFDLWNRKASTFKSIVVGEIVTGIASANVFLLPPWFNAGPDLEDRWGDILTKGPARMRDWVKSCNVYAFSDLAVLVDTPLGLRCTADAASLRFYADTFEELKKHAYPPTEAKSIVEQIRLASLMIFGDPPWDEAEDVQDGEGVG